MNQVDRAELRRLASEMSARVEAVAALSDRHQRSNEHYIFLNERQQAIIVLYFGMHDGRPRNVDEIAGSLQLPRGTVVSVLNRAIGQFRVNGNPVRLSENRQWHGYKRGPTGKTVSISKRGSTGKRKHYDCGNGLTACGAPVMDRSVTDTVAEVQCKNCLAAIEL